MESTVDIYKKKHYIYTYTGLEIFKRLSAYSIMLRVALSFLNVVTMTIALSGRPPAQHFLLGTNHIHILSIVGRYQYFVIVCWCGLMSICGFRRQVVIEEGEG